METSVKNTVVVTLKLDKDEALWLKALVQNSIGCSPQDEDPYHRKMRRVYWDALVGVDYNV
jgi:hypothetical protein